MKFSMKKLFFLKVGLLTVCLNLSPMPTPEVADVSKFFGGASSSAELQGRIDSNFDSLGCIWGHCLPNARPGLADTKLREVGAIMDQTHLRLEDGPLSHKATTIVEADRVELERREMALSRIGRCLTGFKEGVGSAKKRIMVEAGTVDQVAKTRTADVNEHGFNVARFVNREMILPHVELGLCLDRVKDDFTDEDGYEDPVVRAAIRSVHTLTDEGKKYETSIRAIDRASRARARMLAKQARDKEVCAVDASPWGCRAKHAFSDVADGWAAVADAVADKAHALQEVNWTNTVLDARDTALGYGTQALEYGTDWEAHPCQSYAVQGSKVVGGAALAAIGLYAAYKLSKLGWRGACALKNALWTNRSKKARAAIFMALGAAITVAPSIAMHYGVMPQ
ncbi:MAG: hypothetical protein V1646_00355 [bacterium]